MIIDLILDRKDGHEYNAREFYYEVLEYESTFNFNRAISRAMDYGTENDVKKRYVITLLVSVTILKYAPI